MGNLVAEAVTLTLLVVLPISGIYFIIMLVTENAIALSSIRLYSLASVDKSIIILERQICFYIVKIPLTL